MNRRPLPLTPKDRVTLGLGSLIICGVILAHKPFDLWVINITSLWAVIGLSSLIAGLYKADSATSRLWAFGTGTGAAITLLLSNWLRFLEVEQPSNYNTLQLFLLVTLILSLALERRAWRDLKGSRKKGTTP